jgi:ankyrin repeat protein
MTDANSTNQLYTDVRVRSPLSPMSKSTAFGLGSELLLGHGSYEEKWYNEEEQHRSQQQYNQHHQHKLHDTVTGVYEEKYDADEYYNQQSKSQFQSQSHTNLQPNHLSSIIHTSTSSSFSKKMSPRVQEILYSRKGSEQIFDVCLNTLMGGEHGTEPKNWSVAIELIKAYPKIAKRPGEWGKYLLHFACSNQAPVDVVIVLLDVYPKALQKKSTWRNGGWLPIHCAAACDAPPKVMEALIHANNKCTMSTDDKGRLPLHLACCHQASTDLVVMLIRAHSHGPREDDLEGKLPVHLALECLSPIWETIRKMLSSNSEKSCKIKHADGTRALHWAVRRRAPVDIVNTILEAYPRAVRKSDLRGRSALHWSCAYGERAEPPNLETINLLLQKNPHAAREVDENGKYPLFLAYEYGDRLDEIVKDTLVQAYPYAEVIWRGNCGMDELIYAMGGDNHDGPTDWVRAHQLFQDFPETMTRKGSWGRTCLHFAASACAPLVIIKHLLKAQPRAVSTLDRRGALPLHGAAANPHTDIEVLKTLISAYPQAIRIRTKLDGFLPIHLAAMERAPFENIVTILDEFPEAASMTCTRGGRGTLPMQLALKKYHLPSLQQNYDGREVTTIAIPESLGKSAMNHTGDIDAIIKSHGEPPMWDIIDLFLRVFPPAAKEVGTEDGMLPLHIAARMHAPFPLLKDLLSAYPEGTRVEDKRGKLPLHWALQTKAPMKTINALFEVYPAAAKTVSLGLDYKIIQWQSEQPGMPVIARRKLEKDLKNERCGTVEPEDKIQAITQLKAGHDGAHHRAEWNGSENFGLSKSCLSEWVSHKEGNRVKKLFHVDARKDNTAEKKKPAFHKIMMLHHKARRCKVCNNGYIYQTRAMLFKHLSEVHNIVGKVKK